MRFIDRNILQPPPSLKGPAIQEEEKRMEAYFSEKGRKQSRYNFNRSLLQTEDIRNSVALLFNSKCAYCETRLYGDDYDIDHFRPMHGAMNLTGAVDQDNYWWLSYEWSNLYACCKTCNRYKRTRFPVEGPRAGRFDSLDNEKRLLLDPCYAQDFAQAQFRMDADGHYIGQTRKGEVTIEILNLNRESLVLGRKEVKDDVEKLMDRAKRLTTQGGEYRQIQRKLFPMIDLNAQFYTIAFYYLKQSIEDTSAVVNEELFKQFVEDILRGTPNYESEIAISEKIESEFGAKNTMKFGYSMKLDSESDKEAYFASAKSIQKIHIRNFKIIENIELDFPKSENLEESWLVLLGENGTGKSSVLQAIALALAGKNTANDLGFDASKFVNRNVRSTKGFVKIYLEGVDDPITLTFKKGDDKFDGNHDESKVILMAFGSTRLMAPVHNIFADANLKNLQNLFNPFAVLPNIEDWINNTSRIDDETFDKIATELKVLLHLSDDKFIERGINNSGKSELLIRSSNVTEGQSLSELSAGYQAVMTLTLNIIRELLTTWDSIQIAEGIILIDEIGVHLHPKWKMHIVRSLREIFPAMTFIITTHEPLCLRGLKKGEVALMRTNDEGKVEALTDLPNPSALTVEQLITSKFFGLLSTYDLEIENKLNELHLLASKQSLSNEEEKQTDILKKDLSLVQLKDNATLEALKKNNTLDAGWVANPEKQEEFKKRIQRILSRNKKTQ